MEAQQELILRDKALGLLMQMNNLKPNFFWYKLDKNKKYHSDSKKWEYPKEGSSFWLKQKAGVKAWEAVRDICDEKKKTEGECFTAICICIWWGQSEALGEKIFNEKWHADKITLLTWDKQLATKMVADNIQYRSKMLRFVDDNKKHIYIMGDWTYMKNANYQEIIDDINLARKYDFSEFLSSGENCLAYGKMNKVDLFEGLGLAAMEEKYLRASLRRAYNRDFKPLIDNEEFASDGTQIVELKDNPIDNKKIYFTKLARIHN